MIQQRRLARRLQKSFKAIVNAIEGGEPHSAVDAVRALLLMHVPLCKTVHHETRDAFVERRRSPGPPRLNGRRCRSWSMICRRSTSSCWGGWPIIWRASSDGKD